jgi:two-component system, response regulator
MNARNILLVEDNVSDIELTRHALAIARVTNQIDVVEDGEEALEYLFHTGRHRDAPPDQLPAVILLDIKLPIMDGLEVLRAIRENPRTRRLPVVILTSSREEHDLARGYDFGVNSYIRKPIDFEQFAGVIKQLGLYWLVINEPPPPLEYE